MTDWRADVRAAAARGPTAMVTVLATEGSAPRGSGARMVVTAEGSSGTIGGGALEHQAMAQARAILGLQPGNWRMQDFPLGPLLGQCCGGRVRLLVERLDPSALDWLDSAGPVLSTTGADRIERVVASIPAPPPPSARGDRPTRFLEPVETARCPVFLFGAGHVGRAIAARAAGLPLHLAWYDSRADMAETSGVMLATPDEMVACTRDVPADSAVLILTHDHALDYRLTAAALTSRAGYVGLIGSATKRARFVSRLRAKGVDPARLTCPIGLPGISGKEPEVIAIAVLAQLLAGSGA